MAYITVKNRQGKLHLSKNSRVKKLATWISRGSVSQAKDGQYRGLKMRDWQFSEAARTAFGLERTRVKGRRKTRLAQIGGSSQGSFRAALKWDPKKSGCGWACWKNWCGCCAENRFGDKGVALREAWRSVSRLLQVRQGKGEAQPSSLTVSVSVHYYGVCITDTRLFSHCLCWQSIISQMKIYRSLYQLLQN